VFFLFYRLKWIFSSIISQVAAEPNGLGAYIVLRVRLTIWVISHFSR